MNNNLLSRFVLGTASFGNQYGLLNGNKSIQTSEAKKVIKLFLDNGGSHIDTSSGYGNSELILSSVLEEYDNKKNINIISKFLLDDNNDLEKAKKQIDRSYKRFGRKLKVLLCHTPDINKLNRTDFVGELFNYIKNNYYIKTGLSIYSINELKNINSIIRKNIEVIQAPFNIFDSTASKLRENNLINKSTTVIARSIFLQGFLISNKCLIPEFSKEFQSFKELCINYGLNCKEICIRHTYQNKFINLIAIGVNSHDHIIDLINIMESIKNNKKIIISDFNSEKINSKLTDPRRWPK